MVPLVSAFLNTFSATNALYIQNTSAYGKLAVNEIIKEPTCTYISKNINTEPITDLDALGKIHVKAIYLKTAQQGQTALNQPFRLRHLLNTFCLLNHLVPLVISLYILQLIYFIAEAHFFNKLTFT